jgi:hypothetical protein
MRTTGIDTSGVPREIGDIDSDGYPVGWIHPETGGTYESEEEYWRCECAGRYSDAKHSMRFTGLHPNPAVFAAMAPSRYRVAAMEEIRFQESFMERLRGLLGNGNAPTPRR